MKKKHVVVLNWLIFLAFLVLFFLLGRLSGISQEVYHPIIMPLEVVECPQVDFQEQRIVAQASWYGFESCTNLECLQANTEPMLEGDDGMACSYDFLLGDKVLVSVGDKELVLTCTDRGNFEVLGRTFDLHKWNFKQLADLGDGVIEVEYYRL